MKRRFSVTISEEVVNSIEEFIKEGKLRSRSHALEYYARKGIREDTKNA